MDPVSQIRLLRADADAFAGESLENVRRDTERGWTVVGLARDGTVHTDKDLIIRPEDDVFVAGSDEAIQEFERTIDR